MAGLGQSRRFAPQPETSGLPPTADMSPPAQTVAKGPERTKVGPSYFGLRGNGMNPSRFGILTLGSDCASITSFDPTTPLRLRI